MSDNYEKIGLLEKRKASVERRYKAKEITMTEYMDEVEKTEDK